MNPAILDTYSVGMAWVIWAITGIGLFVSLVDAISYRFKFRFRQSFNFHKFILEPVVTLCESLSTCANGYRRRRLCLLSQI